MAEPEIAGFQPESYEILHPKANRIFTLSILINVFRLVQAGLLRLLLVNCGAAKADDFRAFFSSSFAMRASISRKLGVDNVFQAIAVAIGRGMFDDLPFEESEVNSLFANLPGLHELLPEVSPGEKLASDMPARLRSPGSIDLLGRG